MSGIYKQLLEDWTPDATLRLYLSTSSCDGSYAKYIYPPRSGLVLNMRPAIKTADYTSFGGSFKPGGTSPDHQKERPMIDFNRPLQTEDGRAVKILSTLGALPEPILGVVDPEGSAPFNASWRFDGTRVWGARGLCLQNVPEKVTRYVNVYRTRKGLDTGGAHPTRDDADKCMHGSARVACMKIELVEGQYDE